MHVSKLRKAHGFHQTLFWHILLGYRLVVTSMYNWVIARVYKSMCPINNVWKEMWLPSMWAITHSHNVCICMYQATEQATMKMSLPSLLDPLWHRHVRQELHEISNGQLSNILIFIGFLISLCDKRCPSSTFAQIVSQVTWLPRLVNPRSFITPPVTWKHGWRDVIEFSVAQQGYYTECFGPWTFFSWWTTDSTGSHNSTKYTRRCSHK